jgi:hypothetical protein
LICEILRREAKTLFNSQERPSTQATDQP